MNLMQCWRDTPRSERLALKFFFALCVIGLIFALVSCGRSERAYEKITVGQLEKGEVKADAIPVEPRTRLVELLAMTVEHVQKAIDARRAAEIAGIKAESEKRVEQAKADAQVAIANAEKDRIDSIKFYVFWLMAGATALVAAGVGVSILGFWLQRERWMFCGAIQGGACLVLLVLLNAVRYAAVKYGGWIGAGITIVGALGVLGLVVYLVLRLWGKRAAKPVVQKLAGEGRVEEAGALQAFVAGLNGASDRARELRKKITSSLAAGIPGGAT